MNKWLRVSLFLCTLSLFIVAIVGMAATDPPNDWVEIVEEAAWISFVALLVVNYLLDRKPPAADAAMSPPRMMAWCFAGIAVACQLVAIVGGLAGEGRYKWAEAFEVTGTLFTLFLLLVIVTMRGGGAREGSDA